MDKQDVIENVIEWIETLAAEEFKQGRGMLEDNGAFCCLGVGNMLLNRPYDISDPSYPSASYLGDGDGDLPVPELGLKRGGQIDLAMLNDDNRYSFSEIAAEMVKNPSNYFTKPVAEGVKEYFW